MRVSLFWRTFLLVAALVVFSLAATWQMSRVLDRTPAEQRLAWEIASVVNLTRSALVSSQGERRRLLLDELARDEGVRVALLEAGDRTAPLSDHGDAELLGGLVLVANKVAAQEGLTDFRLTVNCGPQAGQSVFHIHLHVMGGRDFSWPPG